MQVDAVNGSSIRNRWTEATAQPSAAVTEAVAPPAARSAAQQLDAAAPAKPRRWLELDDEEVQQLAHEAGLAPATLQHVRAFVVKRQICSTMDTSVLLARIRALQKILGTEMAEAMLIKKSHVLIYRCVCPATGTMHEMVTVSEHVHYLRCVSGGHGTRRSTWLVIPARFTLVHYVQV